MKIYALCDATTLDKRGVSLTDFVCLCSKHDVDIIQYRNKKDTPERVKKDLIKLRNLWEKILIINDYEELTPFCDGLHLGQEDLKRFDVDVYKATEIVRRTIGDDKIFGISTHNKEEILQANGCDLNYIGLGAYRKTVTKDVNNMLGDTLDSLAFLSKHPVGAIGGVKLSDTFENVTYLVIGSDIYEN